MQCAVFDAIPTPAANIQRGLAALERALTEKTTVHRAMYREGLGWVDFVWGDEGKWPPDARGRRKGGRGIVHTIEARQRKNLMSESEALAYLRKMVVIIASGDLIQDPSGSKDMKAVRGKDGDIASLVKKPGSNAWVLTVFHPEFERVKGGALDAAYEAFQPTSPIPTRCRDEAGAPFVAPDDSVPSLDQATHRDSCKRGCPAVAEGTTTLDASPTDVNSFAKAPTMKSKLIRYNLKDRGRQHTGQPRNFDIRAIMDAVNSPECQERVAARDMLGYLGHWPRIRFGLDATEGGIADGKVHAVEPAIVTTHLKAFEDGTIEHRTEFLDTASGKIASKMFDSRVGGFSSAINQARPRFIAFDYVANPNFITNSYRGVALDDAMGGNVGPLTYDDVYAAEQAEHADAMLVLLDSINAERATTASIIERLQLENDELLSMLARAKGDDAARVLDSAATLPMPVRGNRAVQLERDSRDFKRAPLPRFVEPKSQSEDNSPTATVVNRMLSRMMPR